MTQFTHVLLATGGITLPRITHIMRCSLDELNSEASNVAVALTKAGYFQFEVIAAGKIEVQDEVWCGIIRVEPQNPKVTFSTEKPR